MERRRASPPPVYSFLRSIFHGSRHARALRMSGTRYSTARGCRRWLAPWRRGSNLVYGTECPSKDQALKRYVQHNRNVYDAVDPSRLLVMDIPGGDGWEGLCPFLSAAGLATTCPPTNLTQCRKAGVSSCEFPSRK